MTMHCEGRVLQLYYKRVKRSGMFRLLILQACGSLRANLGGGKGKLRSKFSEVHGTSILGYKVAAGVNAPVVDGEYVDLVARVACVQLWGPVGQLTGARINRAKSPASA